ncbi:hypothetical protein PV328_009536 [Microctonus aethiopoides]|uniref:DRBM domain-containing protein n=1 Tax=Microctonus aethiopoides TaxID=144406 RepID=A0AA39C697_9HYME|nr:hypothetical protein PV328_009536 [Microctonus aethiopoides]
MAEIEPNPIGILQEYCQKHKLSLPVYTLVERKGPPHDNIFTMRVNLDSLHVDGKANTKKSAKCEAANKMIHLMKGIHHKINYSNSTAHTPTTPFYRSKEIMIKNASESQPDINSSVDLLTNPIGKLQEICMKHKMILPVYEEGNADSNNNFTVRCIMKNIVEEATASSKKKAKHSSAKQMRQRLIDLNLIHDDKLTTTCTSQVLNSPIDFHILHIDKLSLSQKNKQSAVTEKAKSRFPDLKKNVGITVKDREDLSIANFHSIFGNSLDSTKRQKFQLYYKSLKFDELKCTPEHLECILENISKILDIEITKSNMMTKCNKKYIVCYTFNTTPIFKEIGVGKSYREAHMSALIRTIEAIHLLLL